MRVLWYFCKIIKTQRNNNFWFFKVTQCDVTLNEILLYLLASPKIFAMQCHATQPDAAQRKSGAILLFLGGYNEGYLKFDGIKRSEAKQNETK